MPLAETPYMGGSNSWQSPALAGDFSFKCLQHNSEGAPWSRIYDLSDTRTSQLAQDIFSQQAMTSAIGAPLNYVSIWVGPGCCSRPNYFEFDNAIRLCRRKRTRQELSPPAPPVLIVPILAIDLPVQPVCDSV
eukprot:scpid103852/ scgid7806/ 